MVKKKINKKDKKEVVLGESVLCNLDRLNEESIALHSFFAKRKLTGGDASIVIQMFLSKTQLELTQKYLEHEARQKIRGMQEMLVNVTQNLKKTMHKKKEAKK